MELEFIVNAESDRYQAKAKLEELFFQHIDEKDRCWFVEQLTLLQSVHNVHILYTTFSSIPRRIGKKAFELSEEDCTKAAQCMKGWKPGYWSLIDAGRVLLLANLPNKDLDFTECFRNLCRTADLGEAVSLYRGLPLYPEPKNLESQAGEGLRTNVRLVFEAIAHHNPYPKQYFDTHRWNHMILKALFVGSSLALIDGLDERSNEELALMLIDFAHERWAARRPVPYELWRCVGPFAHGSTIKDLERVVNSGDHKEKVAAALALSVSPDPAATELLKRVPDIATDISIGRFTWANL